MAIYPFVEYNRTITTNINIDPLLIFGEQDHTCMIDSIMLCNLVGNVTKVTIYILPDNGVENIIVNELPIDRYARVEILTTTQNLIPGDLVFAYTDMSQNLLTSFVSFRKLKELPVVV